MNELWFSLRSRLQSTIVFRDRITPTTKEIAEKRLLAQMGLAGAEVVAFGDEDNDAGLFARQTGGRRQRRR